LERLLAQDAKAILAKVTDAYESLSSYHFVGKTLSETTIKTHTTRNELNFIAAYQAPDKFRLEFRYPDAGKWVRASDGQFLREVRTLTKEARKTPVDQNTIYLIHGSPTYNFEKLSRTATKPVVLKSEIVSVGGQQVDCQVVQFESHRRELREGETPGPSMVWIAKDSSIIVREELRTFAAVRGERSESKRTTTIETFSINKTLSQDLFSTSMA